MIEVKYEDREPLLLKIIKDPYQNIAFIRSESLEHINNQKRPRNESSIICKEILFSLPIVIYAKKDFFLIDEINSKLSDLMASGLIEYWQSEMLKKKKIDNVRGPKVLTYKMLSGCFHILLCGLLISLITFCVEVLYNKLKQ